MDWFGFYLKIKNIVVNLQKPLSETGILNCGVPQWSILGSILFLSNQNNMKKALNNCNLRIYAYDTCIHCSHQNFKFIKINFNYDFQNFCEWFANNTPYILEKTKLRKIFSKKEANLISH